ncbi:MAG: hypothetical protein AAGI92_01255 [Pseudomonadota bacterium]
MDILIGLITVALIGFLLLRHNTKSGKRAVGAHVFLTELEEGADALAAMEKANASMGNPSKTIIHRTYERLQRDHNGKARGLIKKAEGRGFIG